MCVYPYQYTFFMHSAQATFVLRFVGAPHSVHSSGARLGGDSTYGAHFGNTFNEIHNHPEAEQLGVNGRDWPDFHAGPP